MSHPAPFLLALLALMLASCAVNLRLGSKSLALTICDSAALATTICLSIAAAHLAGALWPPLGIAVLVTTGTAVAAVYILSLNVRQVTGSFLDLAGVRAVFSSLRLGLLHEFSYDPLRFLFAILALAVAEIGILALGTTATVLGAWVVAGALAALSVVAFFLAYTKEHISRLFSAGPIAALIADGIAARRFGRLPSVADRTANRSFTLSDRPSLVVLVIIDSWRRELFGSEVFGPQWMPVLSRQRPCPSAVLTNHRCNAVQSDYSDITILTGDPRWRSYFHHMKGPDGRGDTLHQVFKRSGFTTAHVSAQDERWYGLDAWYRDGVDHLMHAGDVALLKRLGLSDRGQRWLSGAKLRDKLVLQVARKLIEAAEGPLFLTVNLQCTHVPFVFDPCDDLPWKEIGSAIPVRFAGLAGEQAKHAKRKYANALRDLDRNLGAFVDDLTHLLSKGGARVVMTGDTGQAFGEHGYSGHGAGLHEEDLRTPLVFLGDPHLIGRSPGATQHMDIAPWIASYAGLPAEPLLFLASQNGSSSRDQVAVVQTAIANQACLIRDERKVIFNLRDQSIIVYDLRADPDETEPLIPDAAEADRLRAHVINALSLSAQWTSSFS